MCLFKFFRLLTQTESRLQRIMRNRSLVERKGREGRLKRRWDEEELVGRREEGGVG